MEFSDHFPVPHAISKGAQFLAVCNPLLNAAAYVGFQFFRRGSGGAERRDDIPLSTLKSPKLQQHGTPAAFDVLYNSHHSIIAHAQVVLLF